MSEKINLELIEELERKFIFADSKLEADMILLRILNLLPNDYELGAYIRNLYKTKMWK